MPQSEKELKREGFADLVVKPLQDRITEAEKDLKNEHSPIFQTES